MGSRRGRCRRRRSWLLFFAIVLMACSSVPVFAAEPAPVGSSESESPDFRPPTPEEEEFEAQAPDGHDIAKALTEYERAQREHEEWLKTPEAVKQREESRLGFASASPSISEELFRVAFPRALEALNSDPSRFLSDAKLVRSVGDSGAVVKAEGESSLLETTVPVRTEDEEGKLAKVDLSLKATAGGFETDNAIADLRLPDSADKGMEVGEAGVEISQAGAAPSLARRYGDKNLFYPDALPDTDLLASATSFGLELYDQLRSEDSPEELRFHIDVPDGAELRSDGRGGAEVLREGKRLTLIPKPFAKDAQGTDVPLKSEVEGNALVVHIAHREGDYAYPILVDPIVEDWVNQGENWYGGDNWGALSSGAWQWYRNNSNIGKNPANEWEWERCCWEGSHAGLLIDMRAAFYGPEQWGEWVYSTPNEHVYINHIWLIPFNRADEGCSSAAPYDFHGLWNPESGVWSPIWWDYAKTYGNNSSDGVGRELVIGESSGSEGVWLACDRVLYAGGVGIWLEDDYPPVIHSAGVPSGGWFGDQKPTSIDVSAGDEGLGVQFVKVLDEGKGVVHTEKVEGCTGLYGARCPTEHEAHFEMTGDSFGEGIREASVTVSDPTGKTTESFFTTMVDNSPPEVALEGQLAQATKTEVGFSEGEPDQSEGDDKLTLPVYNLHIRAKDGNAKGTALEKRSGVKDVKVKLDGKEMDVPWKPLSECPETSCERDVVYPLDLSEVEGGGVHKLEVIAEDFVSEKKPRHIEFEYFPATGMKEEYVLQHFPLPDGQGSEDEEEHPARPELAVNVMNGNLVYRQRDIDVEGPSVDLEVERFYNSMLPESQSSEWGRGWTLAQTPKLEPEGEEETPQNADMLRQSGAVERSVALPTQVGEERFDPNLQAKITKKPTGGYAVTEEGSEAKGTLNFDSTGKTQALTTEGYAKVNYEYEEGDLSEIAVEDPATFSADSAEIEFSEPPLPAPKYASTFGTEGTGDGQFNHPADVARTANGQLLVVDAENDRVERFSEEGKYLGQFGSEGDEPGQFEHPVALAVAPNGDILVADTLSDRVQRFDSGGEYLETLAYWGEGPGEVRNPEGVAVSPNGDIWISDNIDDRVERLDPQGEFIEEIGTSGPGELDGPRALDIGPNGEVVVSDEEHGRVVVFAEGGEYLESFEVDGEPSGLDVDAEGNIWVAERYNEWVEHFVIGGGFLGRFGSEGTGEGEFELDHPTGIDSDEEGHIWVTDSKNNRVQEWEMAETAPAPKYASTFGTEGTGDGQFNHPADVARTANGQLLVVDAENDRVERFSEEGKYLGQFGSEGDEPGQFEHPVALAVAPNGDILVADTLSDRVQRFDSGGEYLETLAYWGEGPGEVRNPEGVAVSPNGDIWISDNIDDRVERLDPQGEFIEEIGTSGPGELDGPRALDIGPNGEVVVSDEEHGRVVVFAEGGEYLESFEVDGEPSGLDVDAEGNIWVAERYNEWVEHFVIGGGFLGRFGSEGTGEGEFELDHPTGIDSDEEGHIWVTDSQNNRVQEWEMAETAEIDPRDGDPSVSVNTDAGLVSSVEGNAAGESSYEHQGQKLTSYSGPEGETAYEYDSEGRMTKVTLPHGTWAEIAYLEDGRVKSVTVSVEGAAAKTTYFHYKDDSPRRTTVEPSDAPHVVYDIGDDGSVLKWWNEEQPPTLDLQGTLYDNREEDGAIWPGTHWLDATAESAEGIASIDVIVNGNTVVHELTCKQDHENEVVECEKETTEWIAETDLLTPGHLWVEVIATDTLENSTSERFWVDIPEPPPPLANGTPVEPKFRDIKQFREEHGLEKVFPIKNEIELNERIFNLVKAWNEPNTPVGEVARASMDRWGVPLRPADVAELEYRIAYWKQAETAIPSWASSHAVNAYAGVYLDERAGGLMRVGFTGDQAASVSALQQEGGLIAPDRLADFPTTPHYSLNSLEELETEVISASVSYPQGLVTRLGVDIPSNSVQVGTTDTGELNSELESSFGSSAPLTAVFSVPREARTDRNRIHGRMLGGDRIFLKEPNENEWLCTAGYGAYEQGTNPATGAAVNRHFLLTAAHCAVPNSGVWRQVDIEITYPGERSHIGKVKRYGFEPLAGTVGLDTEAIRFEGDEGITPRQIYATDSGARVDVKGAGVVRRGTRVCASGATTGEIEHRIECGEVISSKPEWFTLEGHSVREWCYNRSSRDGDSGAPIWIEGTNIAVGILSAGEGGETCFQPISPDEEFPEAASVFNDPRMGAVHLSMQP